MKVYSLIARFGQWEDVTEVVVFASTDLDAVESKKKEFAVSLEGLFKDLALDNGNTNSNAAAFAVNEVVWNVAQGAQYEGHVTLLIVSVVLDELINGRVYISESAVEVCEPYYNDLDIEDKDDYDWVPTEYELMALPYEQKYS